MDRIHAVLRLRAEQARKSYEILRDRVPEEERAALPHAPRVPEDPTGDSEEEFARYVRSISLLMDTLDNLQIRAENLIPEQSVGTVDLSVRSQPQNDAVLRVVPPEERRK